MTGQVEDVIDATLDGKTVGRMYRVEGAQTEMWA
jgi:hypothetical protein